MEDLANPARTPTRRVWWRALVLAIPFFVLGLGIGAYVTYFAQARIQPSVVAIFDEHMLAQYADLQYREASYPEARAALERYLQRLLDPAAPSNPLADARVRRVEAVLTLGRLALLHERNGQPDLAASAWGQAEDLARKGTWKDPSREHLRSVVQRMDAPAPPTPTPKAGA